MPDRIILINKPYKWTSFDVVKKLRKPLLEEKNRELEGQEIFIKNYKVGHAGTLDPLATGLLVLCSGKLTKQISEIQDAEKEYTGTFTLGSITDSYDLEMPPHYFLPTEHITESAIRKLAEEFCGTQMQMPPDHSAKKIDGQRAYDLARRQIDFELKPNQITIKAFEITDIRLPEIDFRIVCSKGTYIRSIAHDFGKKLGTGGHLSTLCRTRIGKYNLDNAQSPEEFIAYLSDL